MSGAYLAVVYAHLATVLPAALIGGFLLARPRGTPRHRALGKVYMVLMFVTALLSLLLPAQVGPQLFRHFGLIHLLSLLVIVTVPRAWLAAREGRVIAHRRAMISLFTGAIVIAGAATLAPGRLLHSWLLQ